MDFFKSNELERLILSPNILDLQNYAIDVSSDGKVFGIGYEQSLIIYNVLTFEEINRFNCGSTIQKVKFSPNRQYIVCQLSGNQGIDHLTFNIEESELLITISADHNFSCIKYSSVFWSPNSNFLWSSWNANFQSVILSVNDRKTFQFHGVKVDLVNRPLCRFSPDENYYLAVQRTLPPSLIIYSTKNFTRLKTFIFEDIKDICGLGCLHESCFYLWDSPLHFNFQMWSFDGRLQHKIESDLSEHGVRQVVCSPCGRLVAVMKFKKIEVDVYDTLTWNLVAVLNQKETYHKILNIVTINKIKLNSTNSVNTSQIDMFYCHAFSANKEDTKSAKIRRDLSSKHTDENICKQQFIEFSSCGQYVATYEPEFPSCIWIWNLYSNKLLEVVLKLDISEERNILPNIKWHGCKPYLAVDTDPGVVIWNQEAQLAYVISNKMGSPVKSRWCNMAKLFIAIYTSDSISFAF